MSRSDPGWLGVALGAALGALAGVLLALALGGGSSARVQTITITTRPPNGATLVAKTAVPGVVGQRLDIAKDRLRGSGFVPEVEGGGLRALLRQTDWKVMSQDPAGGQRLQTGSAVKLRVERG
jgi:hypothetical protein